MFVPIDIFEKTVFQIALTLRRILLLVFVLLGLLPSAVLSWLSFSRTRDAMTREIQQSLAIQAQAIQSDIDQLLFERFENAVVWRRSELMEDLRLGDVDKRVTNYLVGLQQGYGDVYAELECVDAQGKVLASSLSSRIGTPAREVDDARVSISTALSGDVATLALPKADSLDARAPLLIQVAIPSSFAASGVARAQLRMALNVAPIARLLDAAAQDRRVIIVVDPQGRWVAGSSRLRQLPLPDSQARALTRAIAQGSDAGTLDRSPWLDEPALMGRASAVPMPGFGGSGWTTMVFEPVDEALAPVSRMATIFASLFAIVLVATLAAATWIASAMSSPIAALTQRTRRQQQGLPPVAGGGQSMSFIAEVHVLASAYDEMILSLEASRRELVQASKMAMLGELGAVLAHEVRTPLGILRSSAQILMRNTGLGADGLELMRFIESETERLNTLVSTLLETARPPQISPINLDLHELIARCVQMHDLKRMSEFEGQQSIRLELNASSAQVFADPQQLQQVFFNLLSNAAEAAGDSGLVAMATIDSPGGICIECDDSGPGVPSALENAIFDPFVSRRAGGFGLGLAVVRQIITAHDGTIRVGKSRWGGARFTICLPQGGRTATGAIQ